MNTPNECDPPPRSSTDSSDASMMSIENSISEIAENSVTEIQRRLSTASDCAHETWEHLRSIVTGSKPGEAASSSGLFVLFKISPIFYLNMQTENQPDEEELERINTLEKDKIAEYLREKHRSNTRTRKTRQ
ncbi:hypothetical protein FE257_008312 [Aspergillus nanangensis]|uniref:Uncharacterized protein n=1 Tax=Aspergillus nanangensis TaxID=2582783 RepID=A0AAD4CND3_ASPNN|nr:hypothetical protein FE257_008312 [Aspergillus nanangensis]